MICPKCEMNARPRHMHDTAHGLEGTHMAGTERYECPECGYTLSREEALAQGLEYCLDKD